MPDNTPESSEETPLKQIRTFQGDIAEALKHKGESVFSLSERERVKKETAQKVEATAASGSESNVAPTAPEPTIYEDSTPKPEHHWVKPTLLVLGTLLLLSTAGYAGWVTLTQYQNKTALPVVNIPDNQFVTPQSIFNIDATKLDGAGLVRAILAERGAKISSGSIQQIQLTEGEPVAPVTTEHFLVHYLLSSAPPSLVRAFDPLFSLGLLGANSGEVGPHTFLIIKLDSFENAFPGMLLWESGMGKDLLPIINPGTNSAATNSLFTDVTIQNKDARVLRDTTGNTVLLYSFYDNNYLIITDNESSLRAIVSALNAQKVVR